MRKHLALGAIVLVLAVYSTAQSVRELTREKNSQSSRRIALVIGNANYLHANKLQNPVNDAIDVSSALRKLGFDVISGTDQSKQQMQALIREFGNRLANGGTGLFFYAGHGVQTNGSNYLIPVDADIPAEDEVEFQAVPLDLVLTKMASARNDLNIVILDACRNNPFARSWRTFRDSDSNDGLARISPPTGTLVLYATEPGKKASDGLGRNGLFTTSLLKMMVLPNLEYDQMVKQLSAEVWERSNKQQLPWKEGNSLVDFYFVQNTVPSSTPNPNTQASSGSNVGRSPQSVELEAWDFVKSSTDPQAFRDFLKEFPGGANAHNAKIRLEQTVWDSIKTSNERTKFQAYLTEFPNGVNAPLARIRLSQTNVGDNITKSGETVRSENPIAVGTVRKNSIGMELVWIPPGDFMMGSDNEEISEALFEAQKASKVLTSAIFDVESPKHKVRITQGFWIGKFVVTQSQWIQVMGQNPSEYDKCGGDCPVEQVSWADAQVFMARLAEKDPTFKYRLPTEAEWEYAARAGTTTAFSSGNTLNSTQANFEGRFPYGGGPKGKFIQKTVPVGSYPPNPWGLYDMHGNVWEWTSDWFGAYSKDDAIDPIGPVSGTHKVVRGGEWVNVASVLRSAARGFVQPGFRKSNQMLSPEKRLNIGFRVVAYIPSSR